MLKRILAAFLFATAAALPAQATTVIPLTLDEIVASSAVAFAGTCLDSHAERNPTGDLIVTYVRFAVHDVLKGEVGATYTIKQIGGELPSESRGVRVHGMPSFQTGQEYVVFLTGVSSLGFSSPIGLAQGRFTVVHEQGADHVSNGRDFRDMTKNIPDAELPPGLAAQRNAHAMPHMDLDTFKQLVRSRRGAQK